LECEIVYYSWQRIEDIDDTEHRYRSHAEYKISNIYLCDENAKQTLKNYLIKALMIGVLDKHPGIREETIDKIIETCIRVDSIEKDKFEKLF